MYISDIEYLLSHGWAVAHKRGQYRNDVALLGARASAKKVSTINQFMGEPVIK